jgi:hypothetical protein
MVSLLVGLIFSLLCASDAAKLRSWVGPDYFFEGVLPLNRSWHRLAPTDDGKVFVFGGVGMTGDAPVIRKVSSFAACTRATVWQLPSY